MRNGNGEQHEPKSRPHLSRRVPAAGIWVWQADLTGRYHCRQESAI